MRPTLQPKPFLGAFSGTFPGKVKTFLHTGLGKLERYPAGDTLAKEVFGINLPKILCTRTTDERIDVATSEIGNTLAFAAGGVGVNALMNAIFKKAKQGATNQRLAGHWAVVSRSLGIYSTIFALMWAMPFVRNSLTAKRIGSDRFIDVIGAGQQTAAQPQKTNLQPSLDLYRQKIATILGLGALGTTASIGLGLCGIKTGSGEKGLERLFNHRSLYDVLKEGKWTHRLFKNTASQKPGGILTNSLKALTWEKFLLKEGQFSRFAGLPALLFWGIPAYGGWIHASRDPYEKKEQLLKFGNFVACFFGPSLLVGHWLQKPFAQKFPGVAMSYESIQKAFADNPVQREEALRLWGRKNLLGLLSAILFLGTMPQFLSMYLTHRRLRRARALEQNKLSTQHTHSPIQRKAWSEWGQRLGKSRMAHPDSIPTKPPSLGTA
jgi:hypothetical protein